LVPETVLTKICIVSSDSELDELMLLMLDERRMAAVAEREREGERCGWVDVVWRERVRLVMMTLRRGELTGG
jgi:hypothetical protein